MTKIEFAALKPGDLIEHKGTRLLYAVRKRIEKNQGDPMLIISQIFVISNPDEWDIIAAKEQK
jgi:hypothetical protein